MQRRTCPGNGDGVSPHTEGAHDSLLTPAIVCAISAIAVITACSRSSFLYPFNDWNDVNCFFTVGKSMMNGIVPYRDLLEQKGPLLYFLHGLSWLVSPDTFFGVYLLEVVAAFFFLLYSYRIMRLYAGRGVMAAIPVLAVVSCASQAFCQGDSAEELCLPLLAASLWIFMRQARDRQPLSTRDSLLIGILSGCVFWIKFSLIGLYIGWYAVFALGRLRAGAGRELTRTTGGIILGVCAATLPFVLYFEANHAVHDWFRVYLWDNIFVYARIPEENLGGGILLNLMRGLETFFDRSGAVFWLCLLGMLFLLFTEKRYAALSVLSMAFFTFAMAFAGGRRYMYYPIIMNVFSLYGLAGLYRLLPRDFCAEGKRVCAAAVLAFAVALVMTPNRRVIGLSRKDYPQYRFAALINKIENPSLLNYGFLDGGFYTAANVFPNCKAFCRLNIPLGEISALQDQYVRKGLCDFVVTFRRKRQMAKYELIAEGKAPFAKDRDTYYLYALKSRVKELGLGQKGKPKT